MPASSFDLARRQDVPSGADLAPVGCQAEEIQNDYAQLRIASIFVILVGSLVGAVIPIWLSRYRDSKGSRFARYSFFVAKYFGSGVIVSTAFMHLITPANEILGEDCLKPVLGEYPWPMAVVLITVMAMFFIELMATWVETRNDHSHQRRHSHAHSLHHGFDGIDNTVAYRQGGGEKAADLEHGAHHHSPPQRAEPKHRESDTTGREVSNEDSISAAGDASGGGSHPSNYPRSAEHLAHGRDHTEGDSHIAYGGKVTSIVILEAGVVLHSIFIGLTLAVSSTFVILFIVLAFHQTFEGMGLGSRLATFQWPSDYRRWTPWAFAVLYGLTTPVAIAAGLGVKDALQHDPTRRFLVEGFSNAISGGILLYTGVVELLAHEFMFNPEMDRASLQYKLFAFGCMSLGAGLMALLAKWA